MPPSVYDDIEVMRQRIIQGENPRIAGLIVLYSSGVSAKLRNSEYALFMLSALAPEVPSSTSTAQFTAHERIQFYVDSFFAFLYSTFDVIAQVVNQKLKLGLDERGVSFKSVKNVLDQLHAGTPIQQIFTSIINSPFFKNLDKYRNCSTHRRQIYIKSETVQTLETPGYNVTQPIPKVAHILCDDPLALRPTIRQNREMLAYCSKIITRVKKEISGLSKIL